MHNAGYYVVIARSTQQHEQFIQVKKELKIK